MIENVWVMTMTMSDEGKNPYYGTFQGVANHYPFNYQPQGYHLVPVYAFVEGRPVIERPLPCCGLGLAWFLFIIGWFLGGVPWYIGAFILLFVKMDCREKPGLIACAVASFVTVIVIGLGVRQGGDLGKLT
ncbi:hypothetical protein VNO78_04063 [Psophocarpus tetragonolobus]|uniref:60S ribosomal protein L18a-like protein n=1 Tax=Psophocarpus tetragonolobus TaxID=3891 RepID=A0AAN9T459_PSOTE